MQDNSSDLSIRQQCNLLGINRSGLYYKPVKDNKNTDLSDKILDIWLERNNKGWRSIQADLREYHNLNVNHKKIRRLMHNLGIKGILPKKNTSKSNPKHYKYPYILKNMDIYKSNIAWCSDISYIKLPHGYVYLVAIVDVYSRMILDYELSNTMDVDFCVRCLERCITKYGVPSVFNTDQGVQYTSNAWINVLNQHNIIVSMDGKGRWADNIWIERIWRTIKYECIHLSGVENIMDLKLILKDYIHYYNTKRLHSSLNYKQPQKYYQESINLYLNDNTIIYCDLNKYIDINTKVA